MAKILHPGSSDAIKVFSSYAHEDKPLRDELVEQLNVLKRTAHVEEWLNRLIVAVAERAQVIDENLDSANLILQSVSVDCIASDYCYSVELRRALKLQDTGEGRVVPVLPRVSEQAAAPFSKLQATPTESATLFKYNHG